ncbi:M14 family zinc carboxypeptidase [uncultured Clostridium sp.]|uniref:M14 family zinc carboxypeptidase n=1 Tax=uncultured Clostridium sp. TaxID=59620 RepID=UPI0028E433F2|nr:M14 family zinc carboxypeptidase [uncultured Clostridium sp.]
MKKLTSLFLTLVLLITSSGYAFAQNDKGTNNQLKNINWDERHTLEFHDNLLNNLAKEYPKIAKTYPIGHTWRERKINAIELTSNVKNEKNKTGIAVIGNIHGNEQESAESASYTAWWLAKNYDVDKKAKNILDNYIVYIVPVMNPDGYAQSFIYPIRENLRPTDRNGNNIVFSDPYTDTDGDGVISDIYVGAKDSAIKDRKKIGMESLDWDKNGVFGDDPKQSNIDLNRTFDYLWNYLDVDTKPALGGNAYARAGSNPAIEPEVKAVENFLLTKKIHALASLHTGIQCVLTPWCNTPEKPVDAKFMEKVALDMTNALKNTTGRNFYTKQSYDDYPTSAEMIDWTYGRLGIHSYTIEVYRGGKANPNGPIEDQCAWGNELPEDEWIYKGDWNGVKDVWFRKTSRAQMVGIAPPQQSKMVDGAKDAILVMIQSEPYGQGSKAPDYLFWGNGW